MPPKGKPGRPPALSERQQQIIVRQLRAGGYLSKAAHFAIAALPTVRRWIRRGERELERRERGLAPNAAENGYAAFAEDVRRADAEAEARAVAWLVAAGATDWRAAAAFLERRHPLSWSAKVRETLDEEFDAFYERLKARLPPDLYERVVRAMDEPDPVVDRSDTLLSA
jgi:hypothetical protein